MSLVTRLQHCRQAVVACSQQSRNTVVAATTTTASATTSCCCRHRHGDAMAQRSHSTSLPGGTLAGARTAIGCRRPCSSSSTGVASSTDDVVAAADSSAIGRQQKTVAEVAREAEQAYKQSVGESVLPTVKKDWLNRRSAGKAPPMPKEKKSRPDLQHLPVYTKQGLKTILADNAAELEAAVNEHFIPALLPFCPPEVRNKENATPEDVLKVFDEAQEPLMSDPDAGTGKYRACVCGLDTEGRYIVLIQISIGDCAIVFRSWALSKFPKNFTRLLKSPGLVKLGVAVVEDGLAIEKQHGHAVRGCVDLRNIAHVVSVCCREPIHGFSLRLLAAQFANARLSKAYQLSDWSRQVLSDGQIDYAAHDATIAEDIYLTMKASLDGVDLTREHMLRLLKQFSDSRQQISFTSESVTSLSEPVSLDKVVDGAVASAAAGGGSTKSSASAKSLPKADRQRKLDDKVDALCTVVGRPTAKHPYENCRLLNKNGVFLSFIGVERVRWYLERNLAELVEGKTLTAGTEIQLTFQADRQDPPVVEPRLNLCVVCGTEEFHCHQGIVPMIYRRHFPVRLKSRFSHDKVLLCAPCSSQYSFATHRLCDYFDIVHGLAVGATRSQVTNAVVSAKTARAAGRALIMHNTGQFTEKRVEGLKQSIADFFKLSLDEVDDQVLQQAMDIDLADTANSGTENGRLIVEKLLASGDYECEKFLIHWRQYFLDMMQPKHLPSFWSVTYMLEERIATDASNRWASDIVREPAAAAAAATGGQLTAANTGGQLTAADTTGGQLA